MDQGGNLKADPLALAAEPGFEIAPHLADDNPGVILFRQRLGGHLDGSHRGLIGQQACAEVARLPAWQLEVARLRRPGRGEVERQRHVAAARARGDGRRHDRRIERQACNPRPDDTLHGLVLRLALHPCADRPGVRQQERQLEHRHLGVPRYGLRVRRPLEHATHLHQRARLPAAVNVVELRPHNELVVALEEEPHRIGQLIGAGGGDSGGPVVGLRKTQLHRHHGFGRRFGPLQEPGAGQVAGLRRQRLTAILQRPERRLRRQHDHAGRRQRETSGTRKAGAVLEQQLDETGGRNGEEGGCHHHVAERSDPLTQHQGDKPGWKHQDD